ncbi:MAG: pyridoxamine 5'-phosphate oxidase family protein [Campylobacteraceae bacterium]|jgi:nitroimidazol reductase NimA-like FMN-containing flavoprotein (pyridoxamine 5'-phosphate oxidase superfamily)|nr:pyridoxamine 5'-phosphate oxidase family protein [Campylobacteraceae bacterium]
MRRGEFDISDRAELKKLLNEAAFGTLCLNDKPFAYMVSVNFAFRSGYIYFHGALEGRKYSLALKNHLASFSVVKEYAFVPSYFFGAMACGGTQYFASAFLEGELFIIKNKKQKAAALKLIMKKYQNEGGYEPLDAYMYDKMLDKTAVFKLKIASSSLKIKAGQNLNKEQAILLMEKLKKRDGAKDLETIKLIKKFCFQG